MPLSTLSSVLVESKNLIAKHTNAIKAKHLKIRRTPDNITMSSISLFLIIKYLF